MADDDEMNDGPQEPAEADELEVDEVAEEHEPDADDLESNLVEEEVDGDEVVVEDEEEEEDDDEGTETAAAGTKLRAGEEEDDDDEEVPSPDDVEADLDRILKDRLVTTEDEDDDEDEEPDDRAESGDRLQPKRADEQLCPNCFLLVRATAPGCPVGDDNCPIFG